MKKNIKLRDFVYKKLIKKIAITAVFICISLVVILTIIEKENNNTRLQQRAFDGASLLSRSLSEFIDDDSMGLLQSKLDVISESSLRHPDGHFVYYEIYNDEARVLAKIEDVEYSYIESVRSALQTISRSTDSKSLPIFKQAELDSRPHTGVVLPLYDSRQQAKAFLLGIYAVSDDAVDAFDKKLRRTLILAVLIVLITSGLLYPVILKLTKSLANFSSDLLNANLDMMETLGSAIAKRDSDTNAHNYRVTILAVRLAEKLSLGSDDIKGLIKGSFLHDVGKIGIRDNILLKPGKLDDAEFEIMKTHVDHGVDIVKNSNWLSDAVDVVASHHEKCDGSGYPAGYSAANIPANARIFAIADVFDALTSKRPYKEPFSFEKTMAIMNESKGSHFDPQLLDVFESIADELYKHLSGREDEGLRDEVLAMTQQYFSSGIDDLKY